MIDLGSIAGLFEREHELHAYCCHCDRCSALDLAGIERRTRQAAKSRRVDDPPAAQIALARGFV